MHSNASFLLNSDARRAHRMRSFAGVITLLSFLTLFVSFAWLLVAPQFFLLQAPLVLGSAALLMFYGLGYFISPPDWMGAFLMALLYLAQDFTLRQGLVGSGGFDIQSIVKGIIAALLMGYGLFNGLTNVSRQPVLWLLTAYAVFALISASYSSAMALGVGSGFALIGIAFATARASSMSLKDLRTYWVFLYVVAILLCLSGLILLAVYPLMARDLADPGAYRLRGLTGSANSLGPIMALGMIVGLMLIKRASSNAWRTFHILMSLLMLVALILTNSRSTILGVFLGLAAVSVVRRKQGILTILLFLFAIALSVTVMVFPSLTQGLLDFFAQTVSRSGTSEEISNFTGRREIWEACWELIKAKPWFGYGLGSVRVEIPKVFYDEWGNTAATAHNFVLESMISVGVIGTALLLGVIATTLVGLMRLVADNRVMAVAENADLVLCALRSMYMLLIHALVERAFAGMAAPSTVLLGVCVATYAFFASQQDEQHQRRLKAVAGLR